MIEKNTLYCDTTDIVTQREMRVSQISTLITEYEKPVIQILCNLPGPYKRSPISDDFLLLFYEQFRHILIAEKIKIIQQKIINKKTGLESYFVIDCPTELSIQALKGILISIEDGTHAGLRSYPMHTYRLLDIDLYIPSENKIKREIRFRKVARSELLGLNQEPRKCFLCDKEAYLCARNRTHSISEMTETIECWMKDFILSVFKEKVVEKAIYSIFSELMITPKPGLVDLSSNGSHTDMDKFTFAKSTATLISYFENCYELATTENDLSLLFEKLRKSGKYAEQRMLQATNQVNTHKGIIFSFGLLTAAFAHCLSANLMKNIQFDGELHFSHFPDDTDLEATLSTFGKFVMQDFQVIEQFDDVRKNELTNGEKLYLEKKIGGVRGIAKTGYKVCFEAKRLMQNRLTENWSLNDASLHAWLFLANHIEDTTFLSRANKYAKTDYIGIVKHKLHEAWKKDLDASDLTKELLEINIMCSENYLTFGGVADLLAVTLFLCNLENIQSDIDDNVAFVD